MPFDPNDPRASLSSAKGNNAETVTRFAAADYAKFYETEPDEKSVDYKTWYVRGQNFILAYTEMSEGAVFSRMDQIDEYVLLLPDQPATVEITTDQGIRIISGYSLSFIPPGESSIRAVTGGRLVRLFSTQSEDLVRKCSNAASYQSPNPSVTPFKPWPKPEGGYQLRSYSLDVSPEEGRFGRIWRCSTFMVNWMDPFDGPRDATKLSPHSHDDFEQCSLVLEGEFVQHIRWPWVPNKNLWRDDEHEMCRSPSVTIIPPHAIHTSEAVGEGRNQLVDIFCPPRIDFSKIPGWVLNDADYPMPKEDT